MVSPESTILTERQVEVLELREKGNTQREVASMLGTTDANVSAIERAAKDNIEKARQTLELVRTVRAPVRFTAEDGTPFDDLVDEIYEAGDASGIKLGYCRPELYSHLYGVLEDNLTENRLLRPIEVGLTEDGDVKVFGDTTASDPVVAGGLEEP